MKQYVVNKVVYANSVAEAIAKESNGIVVQATLVDNLDEDDYKQYKAARRAISKTMSQYVQNSEQDGGEQMV